MKIAQKYSHLNGEEYLIVYRNKLYEEIQDVIVSIDAKRFKIKAIKARTKEGTKGTDLFNPVCLNREFAQRFQGNNWQESRYFYYITLDRGLMEKSLLMTAQEQRQFLVEHGEKEPIYSYNQINFVKEKIAVEVQFGKYAFVAYDLFGKHMLFYSGGVIDFGIEILPTKKMQAQMSSGVAYYEGEVYNVMRQGRNSPSGQSLMRF